MSNASDELKLRRREVLRIISLLGDPERNDQECMVLATELRRTLAQTSGGVDSEYFLQNAPKGGPWPANSAVQ